MTGLTGGPRYFLGRSLAGSLVPLLLVFYPAILSAYDDAGFRSLSVFLADDQTPNSTPSFTVSAGGLELKVVSTTPLRGRRPLLLILDANSYPRPELRRRVSALGRALASIREGLPIIRVGFPLLDGILTEPVTDRQSLVQALDKAIESYIPEDVETEPLNLGRTLDLVETLIRRAEQEGGPVDCLLISRDRRFVGEQSAYLNSGIQRQLLDRCTRRGSTLYGFLSGVSLLHEVCVSSGGRAFQDNQPPDLVVRAILDASPKGYLLQVEGLEMPSLVGRLDLKIRGSSSDGRELTLRGPRFLWHNPDGSSPPNQYRMRQALDWIRRAKDALADENLTSALRFIESAIQEDTWNPETFYVAGKIAWESEDAPLAGGYLSRAVKFQPPEERSLLLYGTVFRKLGKSEEALTTLRSSVKAGLAITPALRLQTGRLLSGAARYEEAAEVYAQLLGTDRDDDRVRAEYAKVLTMLGSSASAKEQFEIALSKNPDNLAALIYFSGVAEAQGKPEAAMELALRGVQANPKDPDAQVQAAKLHNARKNWESAEQYYRAALLLSPNSRPVTDALVEVMIRSGREEEAVDLLRRSLEANPLDASAYRRLADLHARIGELSEAVATLEKGAAYASQDATMLYREAAELRERRGEYGQALLDYRAMLRSMPPEPAQELEKSLAHHLAFLSLSVNRGNMLPIIPPGNELGLGGAFTQFAQRQEAMRQASEDLARRSGLVVPGGINLLARTLGVDAALLRESDALERMFSFMLEAAPQQSERVQDNPLRRDLVAYLQSYDSLFNHMRNRGLLPSDFDSQKGQEFVFVIASAGDSVKKTQQMLSFFGVDLKSKRAKDGNYYITFTLKQNRNAAPRQQLLRNLGVNLLDRNLREIRFTLRNEEIPILLDPETWSTKILKNDKAKSKFLLERLVLNQRAMRLYLALSSCSDATRAGLLQAVTPGDLLGMTEALGIFGRFLDFKDGRLVLPGSPAAWEALLGVPANDRGRVVSALIRREDTRGLLLYAGLSSAPKPIQKFFTDSPQRLQDLYQMLSTDAHRQKQSGGGLGRSDLGLVLRRINADDQGLVLPVEERLSKYILRDGDAKSQSSISGELRPTRLELKHLSRLMETGGGGALNPSLTAVEILEFLSYLQSVDPGMLSDATMAAIMQDPKQSPVLLDLVMDLTPPSDLLAQYLAFCKNLALGGGRGWNVNRIRTCQSLFHLLALMHRQGALSKEQGRALLKSALEELSSTDEGAFAQQVGTLLSDRLMPLLGKSLSQQKDASDLVLVALSGRIGAREFAFDGKRLQFDAFAYKLQRMKGAVQHQRFTPLARLLEIYQLLRELNIAKDGAPAMLQKLKLVLGDTQGAEFNSNTPGSLKKAVAYTDLEALRQKVDVLLRGGTKGNYQTNLSQLTLDLGAGLHAELGITLLTYCYAYHGAPEADALAFDPNFVRKHDFSGQNQPKEIGWVPTHLEQKEGTGTYCLGSIAGLGYELSRLETAQSVQSFGKREGKGLLATILSGMRAVPRSLRSDRAQEYVALNVRLAREVLAVSGIDARLYSWCEGFLSPRLTPKRREQVLRFVNEGNPRAAADVLSPSELLLLGEAYLTAARAPSLSPKPKAASPIITSGESGLSAGSTLGNGNYHDSETRAISSDAGGEDPLPEISSPLLRRLREMIPAPRSAEGRALREEVEQYGVLLQKRLGLSRLSLSIWDSYEHLESHAREEVLYERICDLKIRLAEINYALGLPAYFGEVEGELAIRDILPQTAEVRTSSWKLVLEQIARLETQNARNWIDELLNRGILALSGKGTAEK